jgi:hypothetical protein
MSIDVSEWRQIETITNSSIRGFNPLEQIPKILKQKYPDTFNEVRFGFFIEEDIPARWTIGWRFLKKEHFPDFETFNEAVGDRFGLKYTADGRFKLKENFVMIMPTWFGDKISEEFNEAAEREFEQKTQKPPEIQGGQDTEVTFSEKKQRVEPTPTSVKRGPGIPRKEK